jgi:pimeloyl-ACP methyl ester carboxylesterase
MRRFTKVGILGATLALAPSCLSVETFFFVGRASNGYDFDSVDINLDGDFSAPHRSIIPRDAREEGFASLESGEQVHWVFAHHGSGPRTTILFHHGNGPHLGRFWDRVEVLFQLGYDVMLFDYPGFGRSTGTASELGTQASADAMLVTLLAREDIDPTRVVLYGHSLGGAVALGLAERAESGAFEARDGTRFQAQGVVTESAWCSIEEMIRDAAFLDIPRELLTDLHFDGCAHAARLRTTPLMLLHGTRDGVVPLRQHTLLVAGAAPRGVDHVLDATHVNVMIAGGGGVNDEGVPYASPHYAGWMTSFAAP